MKTGSLVEFIYQNPEQHIRPMVEQGFTVGEFPQTGKHYTVREVVAEPQGTYMVLLEEMISGYCHCCKQEVGFSIPCFREIQIPSSLTEEVKECLERELVLTDYNIQRWN